MQRKRKSQGRRKRGVRGTEEGWKRRAHLSRGFVGIAVETYSHAVHEAVVVAVGGSVGTVCSAAYTVTEERGRDGETQVLVVVVLVLPWSCESVHIDSEHTYPLLLGFFEMFPMPQPPPHVTYTWTTPTPAATRIHTPHDIPPEYTSRPTHSHCSSTPSTRLRQHSHQHHRHSYQEHHG